MNNWYLMRLADGTAVLASLEQPPPSAIWFIPSDVPCRILVRGYEHHRDIFEMADAGPARLRFTGPLRCKTNSNVVAWVQIPARTLLSFQALVHADADKWDAAATEVP